MIERRRFLSLGALYLLKVARPAQSPSLPPISWACPMHQDVIEIRRGQCRICHMTLIPVRLTSSWTCPVHSVIDEAHAGKCPICGRDLVSATLNLSFTCSANPRINSLNPGKCADGSPMMERHTARAHGNHNPQHGGLFFMASDNWHHLEGTLPQNDLFRLYVYDDYTKPLPSAQMRTLSGSIANGGNSVPLQLSVDGSSLEGKLDASRMPANLVAKVRFVRGGPEYRFDFAFTELTADRAISVIPGAAQPLEIPDNTTGILSLLNNADRRIQELIDKGAFGEIYVPAFESKDLALALDLRTRGMTPKQRAAVTSAVDRLVRTAWQLDAAGDQGDRVAITEVFARFQAAYNEIRLAFGGLR